MAKNLEIEFLEFLEPDDGIAKDVDITPFIMKHFPVPNIDDLEVSFYDTDAFTFLRKSDNNGYFSYYEHLMSPIYEKWILEKHGKKSRYWFNTLEPHVYAKIQDLGVNRLHEYRTSEILKITNQSIVDTNKAVRISLYLQIAIGVITMIAIVLTALYAILAYRKEDPKSLIEISKSLQRQEQLLESIQLLEKERNTSLKKGAKKILPKKK